MIAEAVKEICKYCCRVFGCDYNPHSDHFLNCNSKFHFLNLSVIVSLKFLPTMYCDAGKESSHIFGDRGVPVLMYKWQYKLYLLHLFYGARIAH
jgi:hypothetical protein